MYYVAGYYIDNCINRAWYHYDKSGRYKVQNTLQRASVIMLAIMYQTQVQIFCHLEHKVQYFSVLMRSIITHL